MAAEDSCQDVNKQFSSHGRGGVARTVKTNFPAASLVWEMKVIGVVEEHSLRMGDNRQDDSSNNCS